MTAAARPLDVRSAAAETEAASEVPDLVFIAVLGLLGIVGFRTVYGGWSWLVAGGSGLAAGIALGVIGRRRSLAGLLVARHQLADAVAAGIARR